MSNLIGKSATVLRRKGTGVNNKGSAVVIKAWMPCIEKFQVTFGKGYLGYFKREELLIDEDKH